MVMVVQLRRRDEASQPQDRTASLAEGHPRGRISRVVRTPRYRVRQYCPRRSVVVVLEHLGKDDPYNP